MRTPLALLILAVALVPARAQQGSLVAAEALAPERASEIKMAVRIDARPFIWKNKATGQYLGFFWDICTEAVHRAGYRYGTPVEVDAEERKAFLSKATSDYDLLCDPTTITLGRMKTFADADGAFDLSFSPIVFVANGGYESSAELPPAWGKLPDDAPKDVSCDGLHAWLDREAWLAEAGDNPPSWNRPEVEPDRNAGSRGDANGESWFARLRRNLAFTLQQPKPKSPRTYQLWGYVTGTTIRAEVEGNLKRAAARDGAVICPRAFKSHELVATDFCNGRLDRYYGDTEIIRAAIEERRGPDVPCKVDPPSAAGTYEPYAFVVSTRSDPELPERFALALYGMFEDRTVERLFDGHFRDHEKSQSLSTLFRINSIPAGNDPSESQSPVASVNERLSPE